MIKENTNKAILYNTIILLVKLLVNTLTSLFATRFALKAMGVEDFGLFAVLSGVVSFVSILNTIMVSTSNRFISVAIGRNNTEEINSIFNVNFLIHIAIALITLIVSLPIGHIYVYNFLNYDGNLDAAAIILCISILGSVISFITVPHNGLLMSKENFFILSLVDIISHLLKLILAYMLTYVEKGSIMLVYASGLFFLTTFPSIFYILYCRYKYPLYTRFRIVKNKLQYKECLSFSVWVSYGAVASIAQSQGAAILVNAFFNTIMNAALSIGNTINSFIVLISHSISQPIAPQITKSYAKNDLSRCDSLLVLSTKLTFVIAFIISIPLLRETGWILYLWLGTIPECGVLFTRLLIIDTLIVSLNSGISTIIFASGKIRLYQILINSLRLLAIVLAYIVLKLGFPAYGLLYSYIAISILVFVACQFVLKKTLKYETSILWKKSYVPSVFLIIGCLPILLIKLTPYPLINIVITMMWGIQISFFVILTKVERSIIISRLKKIIIKDS